MPSIRLGRAEARMERASGATRPVECNAAVSIRLCWDRPEFELVVPKLASSGRWMCEGGWRHAAACWRMALTGPRLTKAQKGPPQKGRGLTYAAADNRAVVRKTRGEQRRCLGPHHEAS